MGEGQGCGRNFGHGRKSGLRLGLKPVYSVRDRVLQVANPRVSRDFETDSIRCYVRSMWIWLGLGRSGDGLKQVPATYQRKQRHEREVAEALDRGCDEERLLEAEPLDQQPVHTKLVIRQHVCWYASFKRQLAVTHKGLDRLS